MEHWTWDLTLERRVPPHMLCVVESGVVSEMGNLAGVYELKCGIVQETDEIDNQAT